MCRDQLEIPAYICEALLFQSPDALAPVLRAAHEAGVFHHAQMLGDRLTTDGEAGGQFRNRHRPVVAEARDQA